MGYCTKTILSHFDRKGSMGRYWNILTDNGILIKKPNTHAEK